MCSPFIPISIAPCKPLSEIRTPVTPEFFVSGRSAGFKWLIVSNLIMKMNGFVNFNRKNQNSCEFVGRTMKNLLRSFFVLLLLMINARAVEQPVYDSLQVLYIANVNGVVENCGCGNPSLGGLARLSTLVKQQKKKMPATIFVDGGDFMNPYPYRTLDKAVLDIYRLMTPDILLLGDQEWVEEPPFLYKNFDRWSHVLGTNYRIRNKKINKEKIYLLKNGVRVRILTYLDICSFDLLGLPGDELKFDEKAFRRAVAAKSSNELLMVVFHGCVGGQGSFLRKYKNKVDVLFVAHTQQTKIDLKRRPRIIPGGSDCRYLYRVRVVPEGDSYRISADKLPVLQKLEQDKQLIPILKKMKSKKHGSKKQKSK